MEGVKEGGREEGKGGERVREGEGGSEGDREKQRQRGHASIYLFCEELQDVSRACRMGKAAGIIVDVGFALDGRNRDTTLVVLAEQAKSKGNFPGPCPVVLRH